MVVTFFSKVDAPKKGVLALMRFVNDLMFCDSVSDVQHVIATAPYRDILSRYFFVSVKDGSVIVNEYAYPSSDFRSLNKPTFIACLS